MFRWYSHVLQLVFLILLSECRQESSAYQKTEHKTPEVAQQNVSQNSDSVEKNLKIDSESAFEGDSVLFQAFLKTIPSIPLPLILDTLALNKLAADSAFYILEGAWQPEDLRIDARFKPFIDGKITRNKHLFTRENAGSIYYHYVGILKETPFYKVLLFVESDGGYQRRASGATIITYDKLGKIIDKKVIAWTGMHMIEEDNFAQASIQSDLKIEYKVYDYTYSSNEIIPAGGGELHAGEVTGCELRSTNRIFINEKGKILTK
jgi:hypothetical protein